MAVRLWATVAAGVLLAAGGCGYHSTSSYLDHIDSIFINVQNVTDQFGLEDELREELTRRFGAQWGTGNDSTLVVTLTDYRFEPLRFDVNGQPEQWRLIVRLDYTFVDNVKRKLIAQENDFEFHHDFWVVAGRGEEPEDEATARQRLLQDLAETLYYSLATQW